MLLGCLTFWAGDVTGTTVSGRLTASAYTWQVRELDGTIWRHLRFYQSVALNIRGLGVEPLSFHSYIQASADLGDEAPGRRHYRIYHAYLRWRPQGKLGMDLSAGRQRVYGGVGYGTIDGVRVQVAPLKTVQFVGYAGMLIPLASDEGIGTWDEGHLWGGQALLEVKKAVLGISFAERAREPLPYVGPGRFSGVVIENGSRQFRRIGVDLRRKVGKWGEVYGRLDLDAEDWEVQEVEVVGHVQATPRLRLSTEYHHRRPTIFLNSILSVFEMSSDKEVGGRIFFRLNSLLSLAVHASRVAYDDDSSWRLGAGAMVGNSYIGYSRRIGYGGENDAFSAAFQHGLTPRLTLKANGSVSGYRLYREQPTRDQALAGSLGVSYRPRKTLSFDVEGHVLRNKFYARDLRIFFRGLFRFFKRGQ